MDGFFAVDYINGCHYCAFILGAHVGLRQPLIDSKVSSRLVGTISVLTANLYTQLTVLFLETISDVHC